MNIRVFQAFFLALSALCINGSYSETETNPKEMCGEGCQPLEKGDFSEFFCIYRDEEETDHVYYGICRDGAKDSTEISKIKIKDDDFLLKEPLKESVPLHLVPLYRSGEFLNYFAYFLPEEAGICDKLSIVDTRTAKPQDGAFVSGTRIYVNNQTALTLSHDNKTLKKMEKFDLVEEERVSICFTPGTTCTTDIDTLEIVELGKDVKSVYLRNDIFVYAECSKVICSYMLHDFLANTTYYIPQDLKVSSEELDDFGGFLYLVPKIGFDDRFFDDERRFKYSNIPEVSVCEDSIFGPEFTAVKLKKCYLLPILIGISAVLGFLLLVLILISIIIIVRNRRKLQKSNRSIRTVDSLGLSLREKKKRKAMENDNKETNTAPIDNVGDENGPQESGVESNLGSQRAPTPRRS